VTGDQPENRDHQQELDSNQAVPPYSR
jgi:hypothetical protein